MGIKGAYTRAKGKARASGREEGENSVERN